MFPIKHNRFEVSIHGFPTIFRRTLRRIGQPQEARGSTLRKGMKLSHCHVDAQGPATMLPYNA